MAPLAVDLDILFEIRLGVVRTIHAYDPAWYRRSPKQAKKLHSNAASLEFG